MGILRTSSFGKISTDFGFSNKKKDFINGIKLCCKVKVFKNSETTNHLRSLALFLSQQTLRNT